MFSVLLQNYYKIAVFNKILAKLFGRNVLISASESCGRHAETASRPSAAYRVWIWIAVSAGRWCNRNKYEFIFTKSKKLGQYEFVKEKRKMGLVGLGRRKNEARHLPFNGYGTYLTA